MEGFIQKVTYKNELLWRDELEDVFFGEKIPWIQAIDPDSFFWFTEKPTEEKMRDDLAPFSLTEREILWIINAEEDVDFRIP